MNRWNRWIVVQLKGFGVAMLFMLVHHFALGQAIYDIDGNFSRTLIQQSDKYPWLRDEAVVDGTPYLNENYVNGTVFFKDAVYAKIPLRYNMASGLMEFKEKGKEMGIPPDLAIQKIVIDSSVFVVDLLRNSASFFLRLDSGSMILLKKVEVKYYDRVPAKPMQDEKNAQFRRLKDIYYYRIRKGPLVKVDNLKRFLEDLPEKKAEMKSYAENENVRLKDEADYIKLSRYFNSL